MSHLHVSSLVLLVQIKRFHNICRELATIFLWDIIRKISNKQQFYDFTTLLHCRENCCERPASHMVFFISNLKVLQMISLDISNGVLYSTQRPLLVCTFSCCKMEQIGIRNL